MALLILCMGLVACGVGLPTAHAAAGPQAPERAGQEPGVWGTIAPGPKHVVAPDRVLHDDRSGRAQHVLLDLVGAEGQGFCGLWRDTRDGNAGLYFGRLDASGHPREEERPLYSLCSAGRELEPTLALSAAGLGGFAWYSSGTSDQRVNLRLFTPSGELRFPESLFGTKGDKLGKGRPSAVPRGRGVRGHRLPALAIGAPMGTDAESSPVAALVWAEEGVVWFQRIDARGQPAGEARTLNAAPDLAPLAIGAPRLAAGSAGTYLCVWPTGSGLDVCVLGRDARTQVTDAGEGLPLDVFEDALGGWWMLVQTPRGAVLRHLSSRGVPDREDRGPYSVAQATVDVARFEHGGNGPGGLVLCSQAPASAPVLLLLDADGTVRERAPVPVTVSEAGAGRAFKPGARVATDGASILVAWTEERRRVTDVYYRVFDAELVGGETVRWNGDRASSDQLHPTVAASGERAVAAWTDARSGSSEIYARRIGADGQTLGHEMVLPVRFEEDGAPPRADLPPQSGAVRPAVAVSEDGSFLVLWTATVGRVPSLRAQGFDAQGQPTGPARTLGEPKGRCEVLALSGERGYVVAYGVKDSGMHVQVVDRTARARTQARRISSHPIVDNPALALLDGDRVVVAWDMTMPKGNKAVRARMLARDGSVEGDEIQFELTYYGHDWDPTLASGPDGGFVMAWTAGKGHGRDIFVRFFNRRGRQASAPLAATTKLMEQDWPCLIRLGKDDWVLAWEDDISRLDHTYIRRIRGPAREDLGPVLTLNEREAVFNENRGAPRIAAFTTGLIAVWSDVRRSKGHDACYKVLSDDFDRR